MVPLFSFIFRFRLDVVVKKPQFFAVGAWRSLVAHLTGGQGVVGSNPIAPTIDFNNLARIGVFPFFEKGRTFVTELGQLVLYLQVFTNIMCRVTDRALPVLRDWLKTPSQIT